MTKEDYELREKHAIALLDYCRKENENMWRNVAKKMLERYESKKRKD